MKNKQEEPTPTPSSSEEKPSTISENASVNVKRSADVVKKYIEKFSPSISQFFKILFDFSFQEFITTRLIKLIYVIGIIIGFLLALFGIVEAFEESFMFGIMIVIVSPFAFLINVILLRVVLELIIVMFHIGENLEEMSRNSESPKPRKKKS